MEKYLIALDMDGTLLNSQGKITKRTVEVLKRLIQRGHYIVPASGRALTLLPKEILELEGIQFAVLENGSVVWDWKNQCAIKQYPLPKGIVKEILEDIEQLITSDYYVEVIADGKAYADIAIQEGLNHTRIDGNFAEYMKENHIFLEQLSSQTELLNTAEKLNVYFEDNLISKKIREKWKAEPQLSVTTSVSGNAEFNAAGVNKGCGIEILKEYLHISKDRCIAIGDNENDLEMFEQVQIAVAMGNAKDYVKRAADEVTLSCDEDGVAAFLEEYLDASS
nr:Cof-type HAD-IIB family hydrolase [uncultured Mediterraneibacter sp.]